MKAGPGHGNSFNAVGTNRERETILSLGSTGENNQNTSNPTMMYERGEMINIRENHSQFSNPLSGDINASDFAILPLEQGKLKTMRYSELNESQKRYGIAKWARKF